MVRRNCHYALLQARLRYPGSYVWSDSICINQKDFVEKSEQVRIMFSISKRARRVLSCVGPHEGDSPYLARVVQDVATLSNPLPAVQGSRLVLDSISILWQKYFVGLGPDNLDRLEQAYSAFEYRRFWSRLWILPEIAASRNARVLCGSDDISCRWLLSVAAAMSHIAQEARRREGWESMTTPRLQ